MRKPPMANRIATKVRNTKLNLLHRCAPTYQISQANVPVAFIMTSGKQLIVRKLPRHASYFVDKHLGVFHLQPAHAFFLKKTAVYFFDARGGNPIDPGLMQELYDWANHQGIYHIRRVDMRHAAELRARGLIGLTDEQERKRQGTRAYIATVLEEIEAKNAEIKTQQQAEGGQASADEYRPIGEEQSTYIITEHLYTQGYIDHEQRERLNTQLRQKQIVKLDQLLNAIDDFTRVFVTKPVSNELERILDDFHTYQPKDILQLIEIASKTTKGLKSLRTKPIINWFPATYLLFAALGVAIVIMIIMTYTPEDGTGGGLLGGLGGLVGGPPATVPEGPAVPPVSIEVPGLNLEVDAVNVELDPPDIDIPTDSLGEAATAAVGEASSALEDAASHLESSLPVLPSP